MRRYFKQQVAGYKSEAIQSCLMNKVVICLPYIMYFFVVYLEKIKGLESLLIFFIFVALVYEVICYFTMYKLPVKISSDIKNNKIIDKKITIKSIKREYSWSGNQGYSRIGKFFLKEQHVDRYRLHYTSSAGEGYICLLLSFDSMLLLKNLISTMDEKMKTSELTFDVKYLEQSRVLYDISPCKGSNNAKRQRELIDTIFVLKDR